jgi:phosphoglycolate phosphatase
MSRYRFIIFDFDGTLADSFAWFLANVNGVADRYGFQRVTDDDVSALRSKAPRDILAKLEVPRWKLPRIARHMRQLKTADLDTISLFPGVEQMLRTLAANGISLAMVSSDHEKNVRRALGPDICALFSHFACGASLFGKAPKFKRVMRKAGVAAQETLAIGDDLRDLEAARQAGTAFGAVAWGYACPEALRAHAPDEFFASVDDITACIA